MMYRVSLLPTTKSILFLIFIASLLSYELKGQSPIRIAIFELDLSQYKQEKTFQINPIGLNPQTSNSIESLTSQLIEAYSGDPKFAVIDKRNEAKILDELERQKGEQFIDGYTIQQGKQEGIDYMMMPKYISASNSITILVYEVSTGLVYCNAEVEVRGSSPKIVNYYSASLIQQLNQKCFNINFPVLRVLKSKGDKAKEVLLAAGSNQNLAYRYKLEVFENTKEEIGDRLIDRKVVVGQVEIYKVEDENFSVAEVISGGAEIQQKLNSGIKLFCKLVVK